MHTFTRTVTVALVAIGLAVTTGCFEVSEQYHFNADGSGKVVLDMGISKQLEALASEGDEDPWKDMREDFESSKAEAEKDPNVKSVSFEEKETEEMRHFIVTVEVKDMTQATDTMKGIGDEGDGPGGDTELTIAKAGDKFNLTRIVNMGDDEEGDDEGGAELMKQMFAGRHYTVQIHGASIEGAGGEQKDGYVEFKKPLTDLMTMKEPWTINASIVGAGGSGGGGGGSMLYIIIGIVAVVVVVGAVVAMGGKKKAA